MTPRAKTWPHYRYLLLGAFAVLGVLYVIAPLAIVVLNSFSSVAYNVFPPEGYSLRWYTNLFAQQSFYLAAIRSIVLALGATAVAMVAGTMAAYSIVRYKPRWADLIKGFLLSPIVLPNIVLGVAGVHVLHPHRHVWQLFQPAGHPCGRGAALRHRGC
jgi:putative spermidine/putrescine transport system permease protein